MKTRSISVVCLLVLLARAEGQDAGTNTATNQPAAQTVSTNPAPIRIVGTPLPAETNPAETENALTNQFEPENSLTNQFGMPLNPPPQVGPAAIGSSQPSAPLMGTSVFGAPLGVMGPIVTGPGIPLWGPVDIHPHLLYSLTYGDGVQASPGKSSETAVNTVAPGFLLDLGLHWSIDYTSSLGFYSNPQFKNTVDQTVLLRGLWDYEDWKLSLSQGYASSTDPLVETGMQTKQEGYTTALNASYQMGGKMSLDLGVNQNFRFAPGLSDLHEWTTADWLNYQPNAAWGMGLGLNLGYDIVSSSSSMPFEGVQGRIKFVPGAKLSVVLSGGVQDRQFIDPSAPSLFSPVFSASLMYQVFQPTLLSLSASRSVNPSFYANQVETATTFTGSIHEQLAKKLSLDLSGGYSTIPSTTIVPGPLPQYYIGPPQNTPLAQVRDDTTISFRPSLSYTVTTRLSFSIFYMVSQNSSGQANFAYSSHQVGLYLNYHY